MNETESLDSTKTGLFRFQFKKIVGREPSPAEVAAGKDLPSGDMMNLILDAKLAEDMSKSND